jgi:DNA-binding GntR family transcriptional regulator
MTIAERPLTIGRGATLAEMVYAQMLELIEEGTWTPGVRLPSEAALSRRFGISRPVVRQALARLRESGLVQSRRGSGSYIAGAASDLPSVDRAKPIGDLAVKRLGGPGLVADPSGVASPAGLADESLDGGGPLAAAPSADQHGLASQAPSPQRAGRPSRRQPAPALAPKRAPGYGRVQQLLRDDILEGRLQAGARLKVSEIAKRYSTSTNPAREALQGLEGEGLVVIEPNRGARVRAIDEDLVRNIFDIRDLIEPYLARGFAEFARAEEIAKLEALQQACQVAGDNGDYPAFHRANVAFHDFIIERHHNVEAVRIMKRHSAWIRILRRRNPLTLANMRRSNADHWEFVAAVRRGDADGAAAAIQRHVANSHAVFVEHMRRDRVLRHP